VSIQYRPAFLPTRSASSIRRADTGSIEALHISDIEGSLDPIRFCTRCGTRVGGPGPARRPICPAHVCPACCSVLYQQSSNHCRDARRSWEGRVVMCRRAIAPKQGFWTFPAGYLEIRRDWRKGRCEERGTRETGCAGGNTWAVHGDECLAAREVSLDLPGEITPGSRLRTRPRMHRSAGSSAKRTPCPGKNWRTPRLEPACAAILRTGRTGIFPRSHPSMSSMNAALRTGESSASRSPIVSLIKLWE